MTELTRPLATSGLVPLASENLEELVKRLTAEIGELQRKNIELQSRLERMLAPATSSDDFASALQRTVNRLQSELAALSNPVSNFAVKDFRLDTSLIVGVTELGSVEFRLLQPGANVDPNAVSKLSLSLVPIEKQRVDGTFASSLFQPDKDLETIGAAAPLREILERNHIFTIGEFRTAAMRAQVRTLLIASNRTSQAELARLQARAELVLLAGIDRDIADILINANVDSLHALASCSPGGLAIILPAIELAKLTRWIEAAKTFNGDTATEPQHIVAVTTDPAGLLIRIGRGSFAATTLTQQLPATQPVAVQTLRAQMRNRAAYLFDGWSTGATTPAMTVRPEQDLALFAKFKLAGYWIDAASISNGGKVTISPMSGGLPNLSPFCYAAGAKMQIQAQPDKGFVIRDVAITTEGKTRNVTSKQTTVVVNDAVTALASFMARPAAISSIAPPVALPRGGGFLSQVIFASREPVPGFDVRVTAARFETTAGSGDVTLRSELPLVFGDLPVERKTKEQPLIYDIPATVTTFNIHLTVQITNATGDIFTDQHSISHRNPASV